MVNPDDVFGQKMLENLKERGCELKGIHECPNIQSQVTRMEMCLQSEGHTVVAECYPMNTVYDQKLDPSEKAKIVQLEMFDEFEEWVLLQSHYCLCLGKSFEGSVSEIAQSISI